MVQHKITRVGSIKLAILLALLTVFSVPAQSAEVFTNFMGMKFIGLPGGSYKMGASASDVDARPNELPQHNVQIPPFQIMSTEVTLGQFKRYIIASNRVNIVTEAFMDANAHGDLAAVAFVSWNDARNFVHWLNKNKPATDSGNYRLPTEAEWEYACHAGSYDPFCGSSKASSVSWYLSNTVSHQQAVARKKANAFGLYDMSGNVREWVLDCYHDSYNDAPTDGSAWDKGCLSSQRIVRGGSWKEAREEGRASARVSVSIPTRSPTIGFRLIRVAHR